MSCDKCGCFEECVSTELCHLPVCLCLDCFREYTMLFKFDVVEEEREATLYAKQLLFEAGDNSLFDEVVELTTANMMCTNAKNAKIQEWLDA